MIIRVTEKRWLDAEVEPREVFEAFCNHLASKLFPDPACRPVVGDSRRENWIDSKGNWVSWEDGHGSGYTQTVRCATTQEVEAMVVWKTLSDLRKVF